jgi:iron complex transport system permease protein
MIVLGSGLNLLPELMPYALPVAAVLGALTVTIFLYLFASYYGQFSILTVILLGIAINALASVGIGAFQYLSDDAQLRSLVFWMMGSFGRASWEIVMPAMAIVIISLVLLLSQTKNLDRLQLGEAEAWFLGVDVKKLKRLIILSVSAAVGAGVSISGIIGFVGLVVPHIVRLVLGSSHRLVLPGSVLIGATLMIIADLISRILHSPAEIPISLVTSAIGAPFFLWLISRTRPS